MSLEHLARGAPFRVKNTETELVPPYAVMELAYDFEDDKSATEVLSSETVVHIKKPTDAGADDSALLLLNGPHSIAPEGFGEGSINLRQLALVDLDADVEPGADIGAVDGEWHLGPSSSGFKMVSYDAAEAYVEGDAKTCIVAPATGGGGSSEFFVLLEDMPNGHGSKARCEFFDWSASSVGKEDLYNWGNARDGGPGLLDGAKAGYWGSAEKTRGRWRFEQGPCVYPCDTVGVLTYGDLASGTDAAAYTASPSAATDLNDDIAATGLPPGLSIDATTGDISGTPTAPGEYEVVITATAPKTGASGSDCTITVVRTITIEEA